MKQYHTLFEEAKSPLFIASPEGDIVDFNPAGLELFGYTKKEVMRLKLFDLYAHANEQGKFWQEVKDSGEVKEFETQLHKKDGTIIDCLISATVQKSDDGKILGYQGIIRDITARKQTEKMLQAHSKKLEQEIEERTTQLETQIEQLTALNSVMQMVASGRDLQATLEIVAREMARIFKASHSEITLLNSDWTVLEVVADYSTASNVPSNIGTVIPLADNPSFSQVVAIGEMVVASEAQTNPLVEVIHPSLKARNTHCLMILPLLSRGEVIGTIEVDLDDPDREFTYEEVTLGEMVAVQIAGFIENIRLLDKDMHQAYRQLQELDRLKSAFIGVITHELRSPFVAAELSAQLVTRYTQHQMYDELQRQVKQLQDELSEGRKAIDNVISFASLVGKKQKLYFREANIAAIIKEAVKPLEEMAKTRKIRLSFKLDPKLPPVELDKERINEAIYHLVYNAIKYNHAGGMVEITCFPAKEKIIFKVEDTGVGLSSDQLAKIWEAFAQNSDDLKRGIEGLGLGLALVKLVIDAHNGTVAATSTPGQGSIFGFQIPIHQPQEESEPANA